MSETMPAIVPELGTINFSFFVDNLNIDMEKLKGISESITGQAPFQAAEQGPIKQTVSQHSGFNIVCSALPDRLTVNWDAQPPNIPPTLGDFRTEQVADFIMALGKWKAESLVFHRLGLNGALVYKIENVKDGYSLLARMLTNIKELSYGPMTDFLYQLNKPTDLSLGGKLIGINRLCQFFTAQPVQIMSFHPGVPGLAPSPEPKNFVQVNFDINTLAEAKNEFRISEALSLFELMVENLAKIAADGDQF